VWPRAQYERLARVLISVKSGIDHLTEKLASVMTGPGRAEGGGPPPPAAVKRGASAGRLGGGAGAAAEPDGTIVDVMFKCERALVEVMGRIKAADSEGGGGGGASPDGTKSPTRGGRAASPSVTGTLLCRGRHMNCVNLLFD
jgi:hypothetical protein